MTELKEAHVNNNSPQPTQSSHPLNLIRTLSFSHVILCFSHLRWDFVCQRPQHLMSRFARDALVIYWEEEVLSEGPPHLELRASQSPNVIIATPHIKACAIPEDRDAHLSALLDDLVATLPHTDIVRWYYTPMMLPMSEHVSAKRVIYDCMDELANFKFAPAQLVELERQLIASADVVFTGGYSLYESKRHLHPRVLPFPSSVDQEHFRKARGVCPDPEDQQSLPSPRIGFYGVIDERLDLALLDHIADLRPDWSLVLLGPVVKIDPESLPRRANIHYLGQKAYTDLPAYLAHWDVAMMPFAINDATRFISPTKTPEYLAAGKPVVSTPVRDVARHYGEMQGVVIATSAHEFVAGVERFLAPAQPTDWLAEADQALADLSWDRTATAMKDTFKWRDQPSLRPSTLASKKPSRPKHFDYLIVGAGFAGSVLAERLATQMNKRVLLVDRRTHVGGNAFDQFNEHGILYHQYGPHIFHTNSEEVFRYLSRFTSWRPYEHRVLAHVDGCLTPIPINRTTLNALYGLNLRSDEEAAQFLTAQAEPVPDIRTSEDVVLAAVGRDLYEKFFRGYTRKQWGMDPSELDKSVTSRVPTRTNVDDRYFTDRFQAMPANGYTAMFENMLDDHRITVELGLDFHDLTDVHYGNLIYTGPIDAFFEHRFGPLPYRSLKFQHVTLDQSWHQPVGTVNYPNEDVPYTRITEYKHLTGQVAARTTITYEYPSAVGDPYYPVPTAESQALYKRYQHLADMRPDVLFVGRLATYKYYNMDQVVGQALAAFRRIKTDTDKTLTFRQSLTHPPS